MQLPQGKRLELPGFGRSFDIEASVTLEPDAELLFNVLRQDIIVKHQSVLVWGKEEALPGGQEVRNIRILADRTSLEIFVNDGALSMAFLTPVHEAGDVGLEARKGTVAIKTLAVSQVSSVWTTAVQEKKGL